MTNYLGQTLGNYKLIKRLGKGGFAEVYKGEHIYLGTFAAVKVLINTTITGDDIAKFRREARIIANLKHPNIISVLDFGIQDEMPFLVMDYAPKGTLQDALPKGRQLPYITVVSYIKQIAVALQFAHDRENLIHRDVKPANMLILNDDRIVLSDFGIALIAQSGPQDAMGTAPYMAPEQINGHPVPASDQYALAIVAYEWLSGDLPFKGTSQEICYQHLNTPPPGLNGRVPASVEQVILRALAKDPQNRFPRVQDFANMLEDTFQREAQQAQIATGPISSAMPKLVVASSDTTAVTTFLGPAVQPMASAGVLISRYDGLLKETHRLLLEYKTALQNLREHFDQERKDIETVLKQEQKQAVSGIDNVRKAVQKIQDDLGASKWSNVVLRTTIPSRQIPTNLDHMKVSQKDALDASTKIKSSMSMYINRRDYYPRGMFFVVAIAIAIALLYSLYFLLAWIVQIFSLHWPLFNLTTIVFFIGGVVLIESIIAMLWLRANVATNRSINEQYVQLMQASSDMEDISTRQKEALANTFQNRLADLNARYSRAHEYYKQKLRSSLAPFIPELAHYTQEDGLLVATWGDPQWLQWQPRQLAISIARLGVMAESENFPPIPALIICPAVDNLLFKATGGAKETAVQALQSLMLRLLTAQSPGKLRFTFIDPTGLGNNVDTFLQLADYDDQLISRTVWTEKEDIARQLAILSGHMKNVIQQFLRNQYSTIDEYNRIAGEIAEPYRILVVVGFPTGFNKETANQLTNIAAAGPRCGVSVLMTIDTEQPLPPGFKLAELERNAKVISWNGQDFAWQYKDIGTYTIQLDMLPERKILSQLLKRIGEKALAARQRVEIPFRWVIDRQDLPEYRWWASDQNTIEEIATPLGRIGATKYQSLRFGKLTAHHALIVGMTGAGKTNLLHVLIVGLSLIYHPDELEFYLIDFKRVGFTPYAKYKLPHARVIALQSEREFGLSVLEGLKEELERREQLFSKAGVQDITRFRLSQSYERMPRILLVIDEFQELFMQQDNIANKAAVHLERFVRMGRELGIHVILSSQTLEGLAAPGRPTIHGRPTILNKSTISQMTVRIAMRNEKADSHLILNEDNTSSSLLLQFRPGEAVYNAESGAEIGNNRFQAFWLSSQELPIYLDAIRQLANSHNYVSEHPQIIFDGSKNADINENHALNALLHTSVWPKQQIATIWLGNPISLKNLTNIQLRQGRGSNLLIIGEDKNTALGLMTIILFTLATQHNPTSTRFYIIDGRPDTPYINRLRQREKKFPHGVTIADRHTLASLLTDISDKIKDRAEIDMEQKPPIYLLIFGLQRLNNLYIAENLSSDLAVQFSTILRNGPAQGIHTLIWCDLLINFNQSLESNLLEEFRHRIAFQMSENDSNKLFGSNEASKLGTHRALLFNESDGTFEKFIPYESPSDEWQEQTLDYLRQKVNRE